MGLITKALGFPESRELATWEPSTNEDFTQLTLADLYGLDTTMLADVTRNQAMSVPTAAKIRNRIAAKLGGFPAYAMKGNQRYSEPVPWTVNLEDGRARFVSMSWVTDNLIWYGRAWLLITERSARLGGRAARFKFVPEWRATVDAKGRLVRAWGEPVNPADVVKIEAHHEGVLCYGQDAFKRALLIEAAAQRAADNPVPSIELHQTGGTQMSNQDIDAIISRWAAARSGKNGGVAYTNAMLETKTHGQAAEQLLISGRNLAAIDIARVMGAPAWSIDATLNGSSITYGNVNARSRELVEDTLQPYMDAITGRLSLDDILPAEVWLKLDPTDLLRESYKDRIQAHKTAIDAGIYTPEEVRDMEAGIPLEGK